MWIVKIVTGKSTLFLKYDHYYSFTHYIFVFFVVLIHSKSFASFLFSGRILLCYTHWYVCTEHTVHCIMNKSKKGNRNQNESNWNGRESVSVISTIFMEMTVICWWEPNAIYSRKRVKCHWKLMLLTAQYTHI